jgi:hypothetical protein
VDDSTEASSGGNIEKVSDIGRIFQNKEPYSIREDEAFLALDPEDTNSSDN